MKAAFDTTTILIGDQVKFRVDYDQPKNAILKLPVFNDTINGHIQVLKSLPADTSKHGNSFHIRKEYLVTSFDSGSHVVASIAFPFEIGKVKDTLHSLELHLNVLSLPVDTTKDFRDIKPPLKAPLTLKEIWPFLAGGFGAVIIGFAIWYLIVWRKKGRIFGSRKIIEAPHVIALRELDNLRSEKLWQNGNEKLYYTKLTEIIRVYIEQRYAINALEMTSDEIIGVLSTLIIEEKTSLELIRNMFSIADLVKFAKALPLPDENEIGLLNAYQFVNNTKPLATSNQENNEVTKESNQ